MPSETLLSIAHDLKNPLHCVIGYATLLDNRNVSCETEERLTRSILICIRSALAITAKLKHAFAGRDGAAFLRKAPLALDRAVREAVDMSAILCLAKDSRISFQAASCPVMVRADARQIQRVVQNLIANAIAHTAAGGRIVVSVADRGKAAIVEVRDDGEGIASADQPRVFDKFYRAGPTPPGGLGLGLYISKTIVEAHGGRIWISSAGMERGSTVCFSILK